MGLPGWTSYPDLWTDFRKFSPLCTKKRIAALRSTVVYLTIFEHLVPSVLKSGQHLFFVTHSMVVQIISIFTWQFRIILKSAKIKDSIGYIQKNRYTKKFKTTRTYFLWRIRWWYHQIVNSFKKPKNFRVFSWRFSKIYSPV